MSDFSSLGMLMLDDAYTKRDAASVRTGVQFGGDAPRFGWLQGLKFAINFGADYSSANYICGDLEERLVKNYFITPGKKLGEPGALYVKHVTEGPGMTGTLDEVPGFQRVITNCRDYTRLMQMLANGGMLDGERFMGRKTIDLMRSNTLTQKMIDEDFTNDYLAGYGYGFGFRTLLTQKYGHNGRLGCFGWTGGSGIWAEADPVDRLAIVYMHNMMPNDELYHHHRVRAAAYGCLL